MKDAQHHFDLSRYRAPICRAIEGMVCPKWLPLLIIFSVLYGPFLLYYGWEYRDIPNTDLPSFYSASVNVFRHGESPYDRERLQLSMGQDVYVYPYLYPPPSLLVFFPLSALDYTDARHTVLLINHSIFLALLWVIPWCLLRAWPRYGVSSAFAFAFVYSLTFYPVVVTLNHGQVNILLLAFLILFWLLARAGNPVLAALFLALAVLLKTYPLIIVPMLFVIGRWRECVYTGAWLGLVSIVSFVILPDGIWHDWLTNVLPAAGYTHIPAGLFSPAAVWNQSLNGFFARAFTESKWSNPVLVDANLARLLTYTAAALIAAVSGTAAWRSCRVHADSLDRTLLVALPAMYLLAPFSWEHHLVYLLPSILMLITSRSTLTPVATLLFYSLGVGSAVLIGIHGLLQFKFYGVVILWGLCLFTACSRYIELPNKRMENDEE